MILASLSDFANAVVMVALRSQGKRGVRLVAAARSPEHGEFRECSDAVFVKCSLPESGRDSFDTKLRAIANITMDSNGLTTTLFWFSDRDGATMRHCVFRTLARKSVDVREQSFELQLSCIEQATFVCDLDHPINSCQREFFVSLSLCTRLTIGQILKSVMVPCYSRVARLAHKTVNW
jgi:hypothetical protein